jgi:hypothetical protein
VPVIRRAISARPPHRRFRVDADDAADIRRKAECEKPWSGAEINRACCFDNPSFCATVRKCSGG